MASRNFVLLSHEPCTLNSGQTRESPKRPESQLEHIHNLASLLGASSRLATPDMLGRRAALALLMSALVGLVYLSMLLFVSSQAWLVWMKRLAVGKGFAG